MNDARARGISDFVQAQLRQRHLDEVTAVVAARWLDEGGVLNDSDSRPGLPLRHLLRASTIPESDQRPDCPYGRGFIAPL
jgi:hypothetical protein